MKICKSCKKEIIGNNSIYCCFNCRKFGKTFKCTNCGKDIYKMKHRLDSNNKYCSRECYNITRKNDKTKTSNYMNFKKKTFNCLNCNKENYVHLKSTRKTCNRKCRNEYMKKYPECASNYKGKGKFINCKMCDKKVWKQGYNLENIKNNYCSRDCYKSDKKSLNRKFGKLNPMSNPKSREKVRNSMIRHILKYDVDGFRTGKNETKLLNLLEKKFSIKIERHKIIGGYIVDGYIKDKNIVIEIDEKYHAHNYVMKKDLKRQQYLENEYKCNVIRIRDYVKGDIDNVKL